VGGCLGLTASLCVCRYENGIRTFYIPSKAAMEAGERLAEAKVISGACCAAGASGSG
jgi:hypothetical protein